MPIVDRQRGLTVLRIVYDGPPFAGKTTSLRALADGLGVTVVTPAERRGRTLYFDWLEYEGGLFEGRRIRCQVVSVPGQAEFANRRSQLLREADAVVYVADTRAHAFDDALDHLARLIADCRDRTPPVGVVLQANKRDEPTSLPLSSLRERALAIAPVPITETIASDGKGVRESFVLAVRLALDRVRALMDRGELQFGRPDVDDAEGLLTELRSLEDDASAPTADAGEPHVPHTCPRLDAAEGTNAGEVPFEPDPAMESGMIWPPVDGRALLHEVASLGLRPERSPRGDWSGTGGGWLFHSAAESVFDDAASGRSALIEWARAHANAPIPLSAPRALILADAGRGRRRLWQLVRCQPAAREALEGAVGRASLGALSAALTQAAQRLCETRHTLLRQSSSLPCTLWTLGSDTRGSTVYVGLMPPPGRAAQQERSGIHEDWLSQQLRPVLSGLCRERDDFPKLTRVLERNALARPDDLVTRALHGAAQATAAQWYGA